MIIAPTSAIHTFAMRFAIDVMFVSKDGRVLKVRRDVKPRRIAAAWRAFAVVELPAGAIERSDTRPGDTSGRRPLKQVWRGPNKSTGCGKTNTRRAPPESRRSSRSDAKRRSTPHFRSNTLSRHVRCCHMRRDGSKTRQEIQHHGTSRRLTQGFPDVVVQKDGDGVWTGISRLPVSAGETFVLDVVQIDPVEGEVRRRVPVCVIESRPVLVEGELCHRIRLHTGILSAVEFEQHVRRG